MAGKKLFIPSKRYKGDTSVVSARLPNELIKDLDRISENTGRNRNEIIMLCLEFAIDNLETDTDGKEGYNEKARDNSIGIFDHCSVIYRFIDNFDYR